MDASNSAAGDQLQSERQQHQHEQEKEMPDRQYSTLQSPVTDHQELLHELNQLPGLYNLKQTVAGLLGYAQAAQLKKVAGAQVAPPSLHLVFKGAPGMGKTVAAPILAKLFTRSGILKKGQLVETEPAFMIGASLADTLAKTNQVIDSALGGILYIDAAYGLTPYYQKNGFGIHVLDLLKQRIKNHGDQFIMILAGYPKEMDIFMQTQPELISFFAQEVVFDNYTVTELMQILQYNLQLVDRQLSSEAEPLVTDYLCQLHTDSKNGPANGRTVRHIIEKGLQRQSIRLLTLKARGEATEGLANILEPEDIIGKP